MHCTLFCDEIEKVENYELAKRDNFKGWVCHHKLETHTSDGERRLIDLSMEELIRLEMYFFRPPEELIFMKRDEHTHLHQKYRKHSSEHNRKVSEGLKGKRLSEKHKLDISNTLKGRKLSKETCAKMSKSRTGRHHSEETKRKMAEKRKLYWKNKKAKLL